MTHDPYRNSSDRRRWPGVSVLNGWVFFNGVTQMGFALSSAWSPGPQRSARGEEARAQVAEMGLPSEIVEWMRNLFHEDLLISVGVQRTEGRWRVHMALPMNHLEHEEVVEVVNRLMTAAGLPHGSLGDRVAEIGAIREGGSDFSEDDALTHWLGGRIHRAVQLIFAFSSR